MGWRRWRTDPRNGKRLQQRGHDVVGVNADQPDCRGFDLVHIFNCRVEGSFHQQMASCNAAASSGCGFSDLDFAGPCSMGQQGSTGVLTQAVQQGETAVEPLLEQLRKREMVVQLQHGPVNAEGNGDCCWPLNRERLRQLLREADGLLPNSWGTASPTATICNGMATASRLPTTASTHPCFWMPTQNNFASTLVYARTVCDAGRAN